MDWNGLKAARVLITDELQFRNRRAPDLRAECEALHSIAKVLTSPDEALTHLASVGLKLCNADSSGICLLQKNGRGEEQVQIYKIVGELKHAEGAVMPADESPCGLTVRMRSPQLFLKPAQAFPLLEPLKPPVEEAFSFPINANGKIVGTIWIINHNTNKAFDSEDARVMTSLATFAGAVLSSHFNNLQRERPTENFLQIAAA
jgi:probable HAF family extracellular repeat protein